MLSGVRDLWGSVAFRLALNYALLAVLTMLVLLCIFYMQTVGTLQQATARQITLGMQRLEAQFEHGGRAAVAQTIALAMRGGKDSDTELYLLLDEKEQTVTGNLLRVPDLSAVNGRLAEYPILRAGGESSGQLLIRGLPDGATLVVGRDMQGQHRIESLVGQASLAAGLVALLLVVVGTYFFRLELERRVSAIRRTTARISAGELTQRIPQPEQEDEFARLNGDINHMLDRIESLMDGVRHVSNTIAHNLRTPLTRILARLRTAQRPGSSAGELQEAIGFTIREVEDLTVVFEKLLQIAEAESGARRQNFMPTSLDTIVENVIDLYAAVAEEQGATLVHDPADAVNVSGDRDLLAGAVANLVDNALKYAGRGAQVRIGTVREGHRALLFVQDNGPGIPAEDHPRIGTRFFRRNPDLPGYGLGLSSVLAVIRLHGGSHVLEDAAPGLIVRIDLPVLET
jgi:signal transduction histidine kinase